VIVEVDQVPQDNFDLSVKRAKDKMRIIRLSKVSRAGNK
jgi:hypothetical protein